MSRGSRRRRSRSVSSQKPCVCECLLQRVLGALRDRPRRALAPRRAVRAVRGQAAPSASTSRRGSNMVVCQLSSRYCSSEANGTMANWPNDPPAVVTPSAIERFSGGVCRLMAPKIGPNPAAAMPMPHSTLPSVSMHAFGRERDHEHADDVEHAADRRRSAPCRSDPRCCRRTARARPSAASPAHWRTTTARARR